MDNVQTRQRTKPARNNGKFFETNPPFNCTTDSRMPFTASSIWSLVVFIGFSPFHKSRSIENASTSLLVCSSSVIFTLLPFASWSQIVGITSDYTDLDTITIVMLSFKYATLHRTSDILRIRHEFGTCQSF